MATIRAAGAHPCTMRRAAAVPMCRTQPTGQCAGQRMTQSKTRSAPKLRSVIAQAKKVTAEELEVEIQNRDRPILVDFFATWCGPCLLLAQELEKVAKELGDKVTILKVDVDENPDLSSQLQIQGLPTLIFIGTDTKKPALRTEGLLPAATIIDIVSKEL